MRLGRLRLPIVERSLRCKCAFIAMTAAFYDCSFNQPAYFLCVFALHGMLLKYNLGVFPQTQRCHNIDDRRAGELSAFVLCITENEAQRHTAKQEVVQRDTAHEAPFRL